MIASLGGVPLQGFGENDALTIEPNADDADLTVGADGETAVNVINDDNYLLTIHLLETSATVPLLDALRTTQRNLMKVGPLTPQPFRLFVWSNTIGSSSESSLVIVMRYLIRSVSEPSTPILNTIRGPTLVPSSGSSG